MTIVIPLTRGKVAIIDNEDAALISQYKWQADRDGRTWYARRTISLPGGGRKTQKMHQLITGHPRTDHRNGDGLDNRRANLRRATKAQNNRNRRKTIGYSKYKGVGWHENRWCAQIKVNGKKIHLGRFISEEDAARAYDAAARREFGEFAALNFPQPGERGAHQIGEMR